MMSLNVPEDSEDIPDLESQSVKTGAFSVPLNGKPKVL